MKNTFHFYISAVIAAAIFIVSGMFPCAFSFCAAATTAYTSVLADLQTDESFDAEDYPADDGDHSLQIIQIAESSDGELFLYVYQPDQSGEYDLTATSVNLSAAINDSLYYENYSLTFLNASGVFAKYVVDDFAVKSDALRYYDISAIYRKWHEEIDEGSENTVGEIAFPVAKLWTACTVNGEVSYLCTDTQVVTIRPDQKYVGYLRYPEGYGLMGYSYSGDNWYLAFDCDLEIENLYEAQVIYSSRTYRKSPISEDLSVYGEWISEERTIRQDVTVQNDPFGWLCRPHEWKEIQSVEEFNQTETLTDATKEILSDKQWVLRFAYTQYEESKSFGVVDSISGTEIADVAVLRLKFETEGKVYNLGVVDSKQSPDPNAPPDNHGEILNLGDWWKSLELWQQAAIIGACVVVLILVCSTVKPLAEIVLFLLKCVWRIISAPFKGIAYLIKNKKK